MDSSDPRFDVNDPRFSAGEARSEESDSRFDAEYAQPVVPPARQRRWMPCLIGCSVVLVFCLLVVGLLASWVWRNWREVAATFAVEGMNQMIDATDLPPQDRQAMKAEVRRVADAFREGRLTNEQLMRLVEELRDSPLLTLFAVTAVEQQYFARSGLTEEEKVEGRRTLHRFVRGVFDGVIGEDGVDAVLTHVADRPPGGNWQLRDRVSDQELRAALAEAKRRADEAGIAEDPEPFDAAAEFKRIVDETLREP